MVAPANRTPVSGFRLQSKDALSRKHFITVISSLLSAEESERTMSRTFRLRQISYPLCFALSLSSAAWGDELQLPEPVLPPLMEMPAEAAVGTGLADLKSENEPLVPPLPTSIELPPEPSVTPLKQTDPPLTSSETPAEPAPYQADPGSEPAAIIAGGQLLSAGPTRQLRKVEAVPPQPQAEPEVQITAPLKTRVADPLAELRAQQDAIRLQQHANELQEIEVTPRSVLVPEDTMLTPIDQAEMPTVDPNTIEVVKQRFPDGSIKLAYEVGRDSEDNYVKHGDWKLFNLRGDVIAQGEYQNNQRHGLWRRWHGAAEAELFLQAPYSNFTPPFYSECEFKHEEMDGTWKIADSQHRTISEIQFRDGLRHGKASWWHPSGALMQEIDFVNGEIHGELNVWNAEGQQLAHHIYEHGRRDTPKVSKYPNGQKKSEGSILEARTFITEPDDWWNAKTAVFTKEGMDEKHGLWRQWHPNGTIHVEGTYQAHVENGKFTWWYATGQKALVGQYRNGQRDGQWCWWHPNGQKQSEGTFAGDEAIATWIWWNEDGTVARRTESDSQQGNPASRTAGGNGSKVKSTGFASPVTMDEAPQLLPVPNMVR